MSEVEHLISGIGNARQRFLTSVGSLSTRQGAFKPSEDSWSIAEITEHLVHAEHGGIRLIWTAAEGVRSGAPLWTGESPNRGLTIEEIVAKTWQPREMTPESAAPRMGGPVGYWLAALRSSPTLLAALAPQLADLDLSSVIYPHVISGPLDARQRLEFLRFHLDRHREQVEAVKAHPDFPAEAGG